MIKSAGRVADLYLPLRKRGGVPDDKVVLPLSCFAVTEQWSARRLAEGTNYRSYRVVEANVLRDAGYPLWPTEIFTDDVADPRNEVHFDVVVLQIDALDLSCLATGTKQQRAEVRQRIAPRFEALLQLLGEPRQLL